MRTEPSVLLCSTTFSERYATDFVCNQPLVLNLVDVQDFVTIAFKAARAADPTAKYDNNHGRLASALITEI